MVSLTGAEGMYLDMPPEPALYKVFVLHVPMPNPWTMMETKLDSDGALGAVQQFVATVYA